ncbi:MAG: acyl-CoA thioesterase [Chloroflexi bacterium]|nr:acyl-CoA thioesterase [Chloroflexota bacterium]
MSGHACSSALPDARDSRRIVLAQVMLPADANPSGDVHGGTLMKLADTAGAIAAIRYAGRRVVTVMADSMTFEVPVKVGDLVLLDANVTWVGRTSIEVEVSISAEDIVTSERRRTSLAFFVYVALGEDGHPHPLPPLELRTEIERQRFAQAEERRQFRLSQRNRPPPV